ncbi:Hypothetical protein, putative [Bodo saltans]|uniref:Uncharacterized protein n=1 Tax=Bodo saltans TaxID=75058 RepID=A0A0S4IRP0_BODSA|nr:Hypothetical protein, putative [Bodo saltans]|eukprot:CUE70176.1 Hypothetical protein, putative [Bodo saltans]
MGCCQSNFQDVTANVPLDKETHQLGIPHNNSNINSNNNRTDNGIHSQGNAVSVVPSSIATTTATTVGTPHHTPNHRGIDGRRSQTSVIRRAGQGSSSSRSRNVDEQHQNDRVLPSTNTSISAGNISLGDMLVRSTTTAAAAHPSTAGPATAASASVALSDDDVSGATVSARETLVLEPTQSSPPLHSQQHHNTSDGQQLLHPHHGHSARRTPTSDDATNSTNPLTPRLANLSFVSVAVRTPSTSMAVPRTPLASGAGGWPFPNGNTPRHRPSDDEDVIAAGTLFLFPSQGEQQRHRHPSAVGHRPARSPTNEHRTTGIRSPFVAPLMVANDYLRRSQHWTPMEPMTLPPAVGGIAHTGRTTPGNMSSRWSVSSGGAPIQVPPLNNTNSGNSLTVNRRGFTSGGVGGSGDLSQSQRSSVSGNGDMLIGKGHAEDSRDYSSSMGNNQSNSFALMDGHLAGSGRGGNGGAGDVIGAMELSQTRSERRRGEGHPGSVVTFSEGAVVMANGSSSTDDDDDDRHHNRCDHIDQPGPPLDDSRIKAPNTVVPPQKAATPIGPLGSSQRSEHISGAVVPLWNGDSSFASQRAVSRRARESSQSS